MLRIAFPMSTDGVLGFVAPGFCSGNRVGLRASGCGFQLSAFSRAAFQLVGLQGIGDFVTLLRGILVATLRGDREPFVGFFQVLREPLPRA